MKFINNHFNMTLLETFIARVKEAQELFGKELVSEVLIMVQTVGDVDGVFNEYEDRGMYDHMHCIACLYFED